MGVKVYVTPDEVWPFFQSNQERLTKEMVTLAENLDTKYAVYLTDDKGYPLISVSKGDADAEYEEGAISPNDCSDTVKRCYVRYLFPVVVHKDEEDLMDSAMYPLDDEYDPYDTPGLTLQDMEDEIYEREDELQLALCGFLNVALGRTGDPTDLLVDFGPATLSEILDTFMEYLGFDQGLEIYRPMFVLDDDGAEVYTDYPYEGGVVDYTTEETADGTGDGDT